MVNDIPPHCARYLRVYGRLAVELETEKLSDQQKHKKQHHDLIAAETVGKSSFELEIREDCVKNICYLLHLHAHDASITAVIQFVILVL